MRTKEQKFELQMVLHGVSNPLPIEAFNRSCTLSELRIWFAEKHIHFSGVDDLKWLMAEMGVVCREA